MVEEGYLGGKFRKKILLVKYSFIASEWKIQTVYFRIKQQRCTRSDYFNHPILLLFTLLLS